MPLFFISLTVFLSILSPTIQFSSLNQKFYTRNQLVFSSLTIFAIALCTAIFAHISISFLSIYFNIRLINAITSFFLALLFFALNERFFTETFADLKKRRIVQMILASIFTIFGFISPIILNIILLLFLSSSIFDWYKGRSVKKQLLFNDSSKNTYYNFEEKTGVKLTNKPNIYLLLLESYHSAEALKELYNLDDTKTDEFLKQKNFTDYKNVFSNANNTNYSLANILKCRLAVESEQSPAFALDVLRENGYECEFFDSQYYVYGEYMKKDDYANFSMPKRERQLYLYFGPIWGQSKYLRKIVNDIDPFLVEIKFSKLYNDFKKRLNIKRNSPMFYALRFGANHANARAAWHKDKSDFIENEYPHLIMNAQNQLKEIVNIILDKDPQALILALGDHGALRHISIGHVKNNISASLKACEISKREFALDLFSVRFAVRWTQPHKTQGKVLSHINIFRYVFESLGGGEELLENLQPNYSIYSHDKSLIVREGEIVDKISPYNDPKYYEHLQELFVSQKASCDACLLLASISKGKEQLGILEWAYNAFPQSSETQIQYISALYNAAQISQALEIAQKNISTKNIKLSELYYKMLSEVAPQKLLQLFENDNSIADSLEAKHSLVRAFIKCDEKEKALELSGKIMLEHANDKKSYTMAMQCYFALKEYDMVLQETANITNPKIYYEFNKHPILALFNLNSWDNLEMNCKLCAEEVPFCGWGWLLYSYALEKANKVKQAMLVLLYAENQAYNSHHIKIAIGQLALRRQINESKYKAYKLLASRELETIIKLFIASNCIDKNWYKTQVPNPAFIKHAPMHYLTEGAFVGINPAPWFDSYWYMITYPEVWKEGINPFAHFLREGLQKLYSPSMIHNPAELILEQPELIHNKNALLQAMNKAWNN